jgi:hypothetical protein
MNFIKKNLVILALLVIVFFPVLSFAQGATGSAPTGTTTGGATGNAPVNTTGGATGNAPVASTTINNPINANTIDGFIKTILEGVIKIGIPIIALAIIYSGFLFVSAQGNSEKLKTAKNALIYSLIGAAILLGSWAIAQLISETVLAL